MSTYVIYRQPNAEGQTLLGPYATEDAAKRAIEALLNDAGVGNAFAGVVFQIAPVTLEGSARYVVEFTAARDRAPEIAAPPSEAPPVDAPNPSADTPNN